MKIITILILLFLTSILDAQIPGSQPRFIRGDADCNLIVDFNDAVALQQGIFWGKTLCCREAGDVDDNGCLNLTDIVYLNSYLFQGGFPPPAPFFECGIDETGDVILCQFLGIPCFHFPDGGPCHLSCVYSVCD